MFLFQAPMTSATQAHLPSHAHQQFDSRSDHGAPFITTGDSDPLMQSANIAASSSQSYTSGLAAVHLERHLSIGPKHVPKKVRLDADLLPTEHASNQPVLVTSFDQVQASTSRHQTQAQAQADTQVMAAAAAVTQLLPVTNSMVPQGQLSASDVQHPYSLQTSPGPWLGSSLNRFGLPHRAANSQTLTANHGRSFARMVSLYTYVLLLVRHAGQYVQDFHILGMILQNLNLAVPQLNWNPNAR